MAEDFNFNEQYILGDRLAGLSRAELLELCRELCRDLMDVEGECHGCVHPGNISRTDEGVTGLGPAADHAPGAWNSDELEYMAPELFWERQGDATADVYSVGLLLYAGLNGGQLPFQESGTEPEKRVAALRRRLSGESYEIPAAAGEKLGAVLKNALAYNTRERYSGPVELLSALSECPDEEPPLTAPIVVAVAMAVPEPKKPPEYKVDKDFEKDIPPKPKRSYKPFVIVGVICVGLLLLAAVVKIFIDDAEPPQIDVTPPLVTGLPLGPSDEPTGEPTGEPTTPPTVEPTPEATPEPTEEPPQTTYELFISDMSWIEAESACRAKGGHMVVISDADELKKVTDLADLYGVSLVWIGFYREPLTELIKWVNGEEISYYPWGAGEPSKTDTDGTPENYGLLWKRNGVWIYNDSREDPVSDYPAFYSGKMAYICEYDG